MAMRNTDNGLWHQLRLRRPRRRRRRPALAVLDVHFQV